MALISWNENYSVKIRDIDDQHKKLIDLINELHDAMKSGRGKEVVGKTLSELLKYTSNHFGFEEKLFAQYNYPEGRTHSKTHKDLIDQLKEFISKYESGQNTLSIELMNFLKDWLTNHIMGTDKKYTSFLNSKGIK
ncbi:MAG: bacteriohemerythrin [Melioribacteraceae bacterium]|jgi:hemerythrin-like metal-binding protein|nr:bacteriohemerythrin [Melioribacteraceae bacterium]